MAPDSPEKRLSLQKYNLLTELPIDMSSTYSYFNADRSEVSLGTTVDKWSYELEYVTACLIKLH